jgi:hypothetical protein
VAAWDQPWEVGFWEGFNRYTHPWYRGWISYFAFGRKDMEKSLKSKCLIRTYKNKKHKDMI